MSEHETKRAFRIEWDLHELGPKADPVQRALRQEALPLALARALAAGDIAASNAEPVREHAA